MMDEVKKVSNRGSYAQSSKPLQVISHYAHNLQNPLQVISHYAQSSKPFTSDKPLIVNMWWTDSDIDSNFGEKWNVSIVSKSQECCLHASAHMLQNLKRFPPPQTLK
jgi:lipopolysaccharide biosynthesis glycosyltransferase